MYRVCGRLYEAMREYQLVQQHMPEMPEVHLNMGIVHAHRNELDKAIASFEKAIAICPDLAEAHDGLGLALLTKGELQRGWKEQEWRWKKRKFPSPRRNFDRPLWNGSDLAGKTILIHAEQGFGDSIQFCRYVPRVKAMGAKVVLEVQGELMELMRTLDGVDVLLQRGEKLPEFDVQCPLLSLPTVMGTSLETIPGEIGYLKADAQKIAKWKGKIGQDDKLKVGIAWAGGAVHTNDLNRSARLVDFGALVEVAGVKFYSIQKGPPAEQLKNAPVGMEIVDLGRELADFSETAAALSCLDLVIAVDTSVVHIAGALGKEVWALLAFMPDWRWMLERSDTPWYPTMRFFRQPSRGDWAGVMREVVKSLEARQALR